jgi:hypothetical protein
MVIPKCVKNDFFLWMDDVFDIEQLKYHANQSAIKSWAVYWYDEPGSCCYSYEAQIIWFSEGGLCGYISLYHYAYDDNTTISAYGPFNSVEELRADYEETGRQFPETA